VASSLCGTQRLLQIPVHMEEMEEMEEMEDLGKVAMARIINRLFKAVSATSLGASTASAHPC
jgi:hypothetical protein